MGRGVSVRIGKDWAEPVAPVYHTRALGSGQRPYTNERIRALLVLEPIAVLPRTVRAKMYERINLQVRDVASVFARALA